MTVRKPPPHPFLSWLEVNLDLKTVIVIVGLVGSLVASHFANNAHVDRLDIVMDHQSHRMDEIDKRVDFQRTSVMELRATTVSTATYDEDQRHTWEQLKAIQDSEGRIETALLSSVQTGGRR